MPSCITHYQFALRVLSNLKKSGINVPDMDLALIGAQGPDIFFFHRVFPWEIGKSHTDIGLKLHRGSPARLFEGFRELLNENQARHDEILSYIIGFFCHYAIDRAAHPYIYWWQEKLAEQDPGYGKKPYQYHFRIESALDTIVLRRETGRLISRFNLTSVLPKDNGSRYSLVGFIYHELVERMFSLSIPAELLARAPGDMRHALFFMDDKRMLKQKLIFRPLERLTGLGHIATSLLRPVDPNDWDYANLSHQEWAYPCDNRITSTYSFFDIYNLAAVEACDMIGDFISSLPKGKSMLEITQDRGFASDLPGVYGDDE
ncbi:MAG TPA: zinc dependent phospholipase C family protein [Clostridiales bacterium]|nr:zinc dependent phospholipase C family protein [Clostridiales bacterium]